MYCPRCATQNLDGSKFCRACGTNLETIAIALAEQLDPAQSVKDVTTNFRRGKNKLEKRSEGLTNIVRGSGLISASALVGAALAVFSGKPDWIIIWMIFAGWMACWELSAWWRALPLSSSPDSSRATRGTHQGK